MWLIMDEAHITNIAVHPEYRGRGIGTKLIGALIAEVSGTNIYGMTLEVRRSNIRAETLQKNSGLCLAASDRNITWTIGKMPLLCGRPCDSVSGDGVSKPRPPDTPSQ